jgi:hypothetical protein
VQLQVPLLLAQPQELRQVLVPVLVPVLAQLVLELPERLAGAVHRPLEQLGSVAHLLRYPGHPAR